MFNKASSCLQSIVIVSATVYFYIIRASRPKPRFITAIFVILNLFLPISLVFLFVPGFDYDSFGLNYWILEVNSTLVVIFDALIHWIFAKNYFLVAINTKLFLRWD